MLSSSFILKLESWFLSMYILSLFTVEVP
jgi:hypothetical protein